VDHARKAGTLDLLVFNVAHGNYRRSPSYRARDGLDNPQYWAGRPGSPGGVGALGRIRRAVCRRCCQPEARRGIIVSAGDLGRIPARCSCPSEIPEGRPPGGSPGPTWPSATSPQFTALAKTRSRPGSSGCSPGPEPVLASTSGPFVLSQRTVGRRPCQHPAQAHPPVARRRCGLRRAQRLT